MAIPPKAANATAVPKRGDRVKIAEGVGTVEHPWPRDTSVTFYAVRLDDGRLRIVKPQEMRPA